MFPQTLNQALEVISTVKLQSLGTVFFSGKDQARKGYRYVSFPTSTAFTSGILLVAAAAPANSTGLAIPTSNTTAQLSVGSTSIIITNGATSVTQDQFADGLLEILGTNGIGQSYRIDGNTSAGSGGAITLSLREPLRNTTALANGTNTANLRVSASSLPNSSLTLSTPVGVTHMPVASNAAVQYGWVQMSGEAYVNATSGTKGQPAVQDLAGTAGFFANTGAGASETSPQLGIFKESAGSSLASIFLQLN